MEAHYDLGDENSPKFSDIFFQMFCMLCNEIMKLERYVEVIVEFQKVLNFAHVLKIENKHLTLLASVLTTYSKNKNQLKVGNKCALQPCCAVMKTHNKNQLTIVEKAIWHGFWFIRLLFPAQGIACYNCS